MKKIFVDIYKTEILLFGSYDELERYCKKNDVEMDERSYHGLAACIENSEGLAGVLVDKEGGAEYFIAIREHCIGNLAHECLHAAYFILEGVGVQLSFENQEAVTYLFQYIFEEALIKLKMASSELIGGDT